MIFLCDSITAKRPLSSKFLFEEYINGKGSDCQLSCTAAAHSLLSFPMAEAVTPSFKANSHSAVQGTREAHLICLCKSSHSLSSSVKAQCKRELAWPRRELALVKAPVEISL